MKKQLLSIFLAAGVFTSYNSSAQTWTPIFASGMPLTGGGTIIANSVKDVSFFDDNTGVVSMHSQDYLFKTTDGGATWAKTTSLGNVGNFDVVQMNGSQNILIGTNNGRVYKTVDGGTTFSLKGTPVNDVNDMAFSGSNGVLVDNDCKAAWSSNLGDTWTTINNSVLCGNLSQMNFVNFSSSNTVYLAGKNSNMFKSLNAGATWSTITVPSGNLQGMWFVDDNTGYITTSNIVRKTLDGGATWTNVAISPTLGTIGANSGLLYANGNVLYVATNDKILRSSDGGMSFSIDFNLTPVNASGVLRFKAAGNSLFMAVQASGTDAQVYKRANPVSAIKEKENLINLTISPNPASEVVQLICGEEILNTEIWSSDMRLIRTISNENKINVTDIPSGCYFIKVKTKNGELNRKFIKQ